MVTSSFNKHVKRLAFLVCVSQLGLHADTVSPLYTRGYTVMPQPQATYPANLCPLLFVGEFAKFGSDFGEAVDQAIEYRKRITTGLGQRAPKHFHDMLSDLECMEGAGQIGLEADGGRGGS